MQLVILELLEEDNGTEMKCICQNKDQKQEVFTRIKLEGGTVDQRGYCMLLFLK